MLLTGSWEDAGAPAGGRWRTGPPSQRPALTLGPGCSSPLCRQRELSRSEPGPVSLFSELPTGIRAKPGLLPHAGGGGWGTASLPAPSLPCSMHVVPVPAFLPVPGPLHVLFMLPGRFRSCTFMWLIALRHSVKMPSLPQRKPTPTTTPPK